MAVLGRFAKVYAHETAFSAKHNVQAWKQHNGLTMKRMLSLFGTLANAIFFQNVQNTPYHITVYWNVFGF